MYDIILSEQVVKQLEKLEKNTQERILKALERIRMKPEAYVTKLVGPFGYKLRIGDYRVIIDINHGKSIISVTKVGHRKNIYKDLT